MKNGVDQDKIKKVMFHRRRKSAQKYIAITPRPLNLRFAKFGNQCT